MNASKFYRDNRESCDFDEAVTLTGYGKFHLETTAACCLSILVVGFQNGLSSYIFPPARCELNLSSTELGFLNVAFLGGGTLSCFFWGFLADNRGRRKILIFTHLINALITILCSLSPYKNVLVVCRFSSGFLIGAPGSLVYTYIAEFHPPKLRFKSVCLCGLFFIASWLLLPIIAYLILPLKIQFNFKNIFTLSPWRVFLLLMAVPDILVGCWFTRLPESPKYYVAKGYPKKALAILQKMYSINCGKGPEYFPVKNIICEANFDLKNNEIMVNGKTARILKDMSQQIKKLFQTPLLLKTTLTTGIMFCNMFGLFGLSLWLPELFIKFERYQMLHPNATITIKELSSLPLITNQTCQPSFDQSIIISTVATGLTALVFNVISCTIATKVSSRNMTLVLSFVGGISSGSIYWLRSATQNLVVACIFQATIMTANLSVTSIVVELFPTSVGGIAVCLVLCAGRIGAAVSNLVFAYSMDKFCELPIFVVAFFEMLGGVLCLMVPKEKKSSNNEDNPELRKKRNNYEISTVSNKIIEN